MRKHAELKNLWTLIKMQLRSAIDLSFLKSRRSFLMKAGVALVMFAAITAAFFLVFYICVLLSVFPSSGGTVPETVVTVLFTIIQLMSIWSCMTGLARSLYKAGDNVILLVLPVRQNTIFLSKLVVYYIFELKRNLTLTVPLFLAYGIVNKAVWFYYPWMLFGFLFVSMVPVALGALLSIPALYIPKALSRVPVIKYILLAIGAGALLWLAFMIVSLIPANVDIVGQWGSISNGIRIFLDRFAAIFAPWHYLNLMLIGGTLDISRNPVTGRTLVIFAINLAVNAAMIAASFFTARLLFLRMTARAGESDSRAHSSRPNRARGKAASLISEELTMTLRNSSALWSIFLELFMPAFLIYALNKIYAAMDTSLGGLRMTEAFNVLVLLVTVLSSNSVLASLFSRDGAARNMLKTRPIDIRAILLARIAERVVVSTVSILLAVILFRAVSGATAAQAAGFGLTAIFANTAHILLSAEIDVMNPEAAGAGSNEARATAYGIVISILFAAGFYLLADSGRAQAMFKLAAVALGFLALRTYLCLERTKIYFIER